MKMNGKNELLGKIARRGLLSAAQLAMVLTCATASRAQSNAAPAAQPKQVVPNQLSQDVKSRTDLTSSPHATTQTPKRPHEGITVHGHWTIEVRNPNGKLARHVEFENALEESSGSFAIASLLTGASVSGGLAIGIDTIAIYQNIGSQAQLYATTANGSTSVLGVVINNGIVPPLDNYLSSILNEDSSPGPCNSNLGTGCLIFPASASSFSAFCNPGAQNCFGTLNTVGPIWAATTTSPLLVPGNILINNANTINLGSSFLAGASLPVNDVEVWVIACTPDTLATTCSNIGALNNTQPGTPNSAFHGGIVPPAPAGNDLLLLTTRNLDGLNGDPAQVPVAAGQTVSINVVLSFN